MSGSNVVVLRTVYAVNSNTGQFLSSGLCLVTDGLGGTVWTDSLSSLAQTGGPILQPLPSSISTFSTQVSLNQYNITVISSALSEGLSTLSIAVATAATGINQNQLLSTVAGLGSISYTSTSRVSTMIGLVGQSGTVTASTTSTIAGQISSFGIPTQSTLNTNLASTIGGMGSAGYISTPSLVSTVIGLGSVGYISSLFNLVSTPSLVSTVRGLGSAGYISSQALTTNITSSLVGLGTMGYISGPTLLSAINVGFSTTVTNSSLVGLGSMGYVSTATLLSTSKGLADMKANIRFDNTTSITTIGSVNYFSNAANIIYISTFLQSSLYYSGNNSSLEGTVVGTHGMRFSTLSLNMSPFSSFINLSSFITLDVYPTISFTKLATGATGPAMLPISSFLRCGSVDLLSTSVTTFMFAGNTRIALESGAYADSSNIFNQPIRLALPPGTISSYTDPYSLVHFMPSSLNNGSFQNALHSNTIVPFFGSTGSVFLSVQNRTS